jgi:hypothetical protein
MGEAEEFYYYKGQSYGIILSMCLCNPVNVILNVNTCRSR